jgi:H+/Cl- antiporter ClcA
MLSLGIFFGLCASLLRSCTGPEEIFKSKISYPPLRPFVGGIIVASAVWAIGTTKYIGLGIPTIVASFDQQLPAYDFALKMIFTIVTLSAGFKGGEVTLVLYWCYIRKCFKLFYSASTRTFWPEWDL